MLAGFKEEHRLERGLYFVNREGVIPQQLARDEQELPEWT